MGAPKQPAFACIYVILKNWKRNLLSKTTIKSCFVQRNPQQQPEQQKKTKQKQKGETCLHISLYRNESDIYNYI